MSGAALPPQAVSRQQAENAARQVLPGVTSQASGVAEKFALFSDDQYAVVAPETGHIVSYHFQAVPAWVLTFTGVTLPNHGPGDNANHELNVVIDARTGQYLEMFSYR
jgi:hypothetical protein